MIYDADNRPITDANVLVEQDSNYDFTAKIECAAGFAIDYVSNDAAIVIFCKASAGDSYTSLALAPFDVTPYAGQKRTFYFRAAIGSAANQGLTLVRITVNKV